MFNHHLFRAMMLLAALPAFSQSIDDVQVYTERDEATGEVTVYAVNDHIIPVYVVIDLQRSVNVQTTAALPFGYQLAAGERETPLFKVSPQNQGRSYSFGVQYAVARGDPFSARHDDSYRYLFPYAHGVKHRITQGFNGRFTHFGENRFAVDFDLPLGEAVHAARGGLVVEVKEDSRTGGSSAVYEGTANYIFIMHDDGSFGNYAHLQFNGVQVAPGQQVAAGELIGYSGNTGRSSGPHLHFDVRVPTANGTMVSVPIMFLNRKEEAVAPEEAKYYYAAHPGKPAFEVYLGEELTPNQFADYRVQVAQTDKFDFRTEKIDLTFVGYLSNGFDRAVTVEVSFSVQGARADLTYPQQINIPARTEVFVGLFRALPNSQRIVISPRVQEIR